jgi:hypothetical protein
MNVQKKSVIPLDGPQKEFVFMVRGSNGPGCGRSRPLRMRPQQAVADAPVYLHAVSPTVITCAGSRCAALRRT